MLRLFMILAVVSIAIGLASQLSIFRPGTRSEFTGNHWSSGFEPVFFNGKWQINEGTLLVSFVYNSIPVTTTSHLNGLAAFRNSV